MRTLTRIRIPDEQETKASQVPRLRPAIQRMVQGRTADGAIAIYAPEARGARRGQRTASGTIRRYGRGARYSRTLREHQQPGKVTNMTPDEILHDMGWVVSFSSCGALEGEKWWGACGQPMGCLGGRHIKVDRLETFDEAVEAFLEAYKDPERKHDVNWSEEEIDKRIYDLESQLPHLRWMLDRKQKGLDIYGIDRDPDAERASATRKGGA